MLAILAVIGFTLGQSAAEKPFAVDYVDEEILLLGAGTSWQTCVTQNDFMIENRSDEATELMVLLGDREFMPEWLNTNEKKLYSLKEIIPSAKARGKSVDANDIPTVINMNPGVEDIILNCPR